MWRSKAAKVILLVIAITAIAVSQSSAMQSVAARTSATVYVLLHYRELGLRFDNVEYSPPFGDYFASFTGKDGRKISFTVTPKFMPVLISYDPLDPGP
ncbi:hypothetical protein [Paenibacillus thalictri]|uniref:DUF3888 domain-containing protein n=1 Tax=Paenibacillus thalictri TaxID=2527873 RepID=A0A4Q9DW52_9BACL|nr:hypothetical protein [Paenibacillus thalictri]TBL79381.1 hypothetical protein EYB31_10715 [Paenibacillus thalictri]